MNNDNIYRPTERFSQKLEKVKQVDPPGYKRICQVVERLVAEPGDADGIMHGVYQGRFKKYVGRRDYRVIYYWCKICRKENRRLENECEGCLAIPDYSVIFFDLYHKNELKKIKKNS